MCLKIFKNSVVNTQFLDSMSDMLSDDPLLVNQIFDKPLDMGFDYDGDTSFDDFFANLQ